ncbi:MAG: S8 family serine peptidase [Gammaproteobacteria bacterium]|nr:S8 family serine peptidase [Gammaproteobacteria bacterium]
MYTMVKPTFCAISASIFLMIMSAVAIADYQAESFSTAQAGSTKEIIKYSPDELLVKFKTITLVNKSNAVDHLKSTGHLKSAAGTSLATLGIVSAEQFGAINNRKLGAKTLNQSDFSNWWHIKLGKGTDLQQVLEILSARPDVEFVEYNYVVRANLLPNDPRFDSLWGLDNTQQTGGSFDADIDAPEAWGSGTGSGNIIVAVIDTGVDYGHEDLAANMWTNLGEVPGNGIDDDGNGYVDDVYGYDFINTDSDPFDDNGHGTHVAGTIAAVGNNGIGVTGVNWKAQIMAVKFLGANGGGAASDALNGIIYAVNNGAIILNNSWGGANFSRAMFDAISAANDAGVLFVAAAGNGNNNNDVSSYYPADYSVPNVISVAATDHNDQLAIFSNGNASNYGANTVHLGAPGLDILSTVPTGSCTLCRSEGYLSISGTSMAAPHVSGAAALIFDRIPELSIGDLKLRLMASTDQIPALSGTTISGGRLNIAAGTVYNPNISATLAPVLQSVLPNEAATYTVTITSIGDTTEQVNLSLGALDTGITADIANTLLILPAGGSVTTTLTVTAALNVPRGSYSVPILVADETAQVYSYRVVTLKVLRPDFDVAISPSKQQISPGGSTTYDVVFTSIDGFASTLSISAVSPHASISMDVLPFQVILQSDGTAVATISVSTDATTPTLPHTLGVTATDGQSTRSIDAQLNVAEGDLIMTAISTPDDGSASVGSYLGMTYSYYDAGGFPANNPYHVGIYLSSDATITTDDIRIGAVFNLTLTEGRSVTARNSYLIPANLASGTYYLGAIVDYNNLLNESNEGNNVRVASTTLQLSQAVDLLVSSVSIPDSAYAGTPFDVTYTVRNAGGAPARGGYRVGIYLAQKSSFRVTPADTRIGTTYFLSTLDGEGSRTSTISSLIPPGLAAGRYRLGVIVDSDNQQSESNENNNRRMASLPLQVDVKPEADLLISSVSTLDSQVYTDDSIDITYTLRNVGNFPAKSFLVGFYLSSDATITTEDALIGEDFNFVLTNKKLAEGDSYTQTITSFPIPSLYLGSDYYLGVIVDYDNRQKESDEGNNALVSASSLDVLGRFDLSSSLREIPGSVYVGVPFDVTYVVVNHAPDVTNGGYRVGYYLSNNNRPTTADILLGTSDFPELGGNGAFKQKTVSLIIPPSVAVGTYTLGIIVDDDNQQAESNENNNLSRYENFRVQVNQEVDLLISSVSTPDSQVYTGASIDVTYAVHNAGGSRTSSSSVVGIYLSSDADITTSDTRLGARYIPGLDGGGSRTQTASFRIPASLAGGNYYLGVIADYNNREAESNEDNNVGMVSTALQVSQ